MAKTCPRHRPNPGPNSRRRPKPARKRRNPANSHFGGSPPVAAPTPTPTKATRRHTNRLRGSTAIETATLHINQVCSTGDSTGGTLRGCSTSQSRASARDATRDKPSSGHGSRNIKGSARVSAESLMLQLRWTTAGRQSPFSPHPHSLRHGANTSFHRVSGQLRGSALCIFWRNRGGPNDN